MALINVINVKSVSQTWWYLKKLPILCTRSTGPYGLFRVQYSSAQYCAAQYCGLTYNCNCIATLQSCDCYTVTMLHCYTATLLYIYTITHLHCHNQVNVVTTQLHLVTTRSMSTQPGHIYEGNLSKILLPILSRS